MATTEAILAAAGGRRRLVDHLPDPPLAPDGQPLLPGQQNDSVGGALTSAQTSGVVLLFLLAVVVVIACLLYTICNKAEQEPSREDAGRPPTSNGGGSEDRRRAQRQQASPAVAVVAAVAVGDIESGKVLPPPARPPPRPRALVECTYRAAEGWEESTCSVCLAELADGESVTVLMACRHYFHTACVVEWLRKSATCPLCRAPPLPTKPARRRR